MKSLLKMSAKISERNIFIIIVVLFLGSASLIENPRNGQPHLEEITGGLRMIDMNYYNSPASIDQYLHELGDAGRIAYKHLLLFDCLLIINLALFSVGLIYRLSRANGFHKKWDWLIILPICRALCDFLETAAMMVNVSVFPGSFQFTVYTAVISTPAKWLFFAASMLTIIILWLIFLIKKIYQWSNNDRSKQRQTNTINRNYQ